MIARINISASLLAASLAMGLSQAIAQEDEAFMPKGGKTLFLELKDTPRAAELADIGHSSHTEAEWRSYLAERHKQLGEREAKRARRLSPVNFPLPEGAVQQAGNDIARGVAARWTRTRLDAVSILSFAVFRLPDATA